jgi:hypothetical protein
MRLTKSRFLQSVSAHQFYFARSAAGRNHLTHRRPALIHPASLGSKSTVLHVCVLGASIRPVSPLLFRPIWPVMAWTCPAPFWCGNGPEDCRNGLATQYAAISWRGEISS